MKNKKLIFGITAIVLAAAIFTISEMMTNAKPPEHRTAFFPGIEERHITAIEIRDGESSIKLEKKDALWRGGINPPLIEGGGVGVADGADIASVAGVADSADTAGVAGFEEGKVGKAGTEWFEADSASVQIAIEKILSLKKTEQISANPDNQSKFEVDSASGMTVEVIASGKTVGILRIGKGGPEWGSNYVRLMGSDAVYLVRGGIKQTFVTDIEPWKKKEPPPEPEPEPDSTANDETEIQ